MKIFFSVLIAISMSVGFLYANEKVDSLSIIKIKKLIQKEEDISLAYKEYLLKNGKAPTDVKDLIDNAFLPKGFSVINPFGKEIKLISTKNKIEEFRSDNLALTSALNQYYYTDIYRNNTKSSQKAKQNININLNFTEDFIYKNQSIITNNEVDAKTKYYIQNGVLNWFDENGNYKFTIAKDILSKDQIINEDINNQIKIDKNSESKFYELMYIGKKLYQQSKQNPNELDEFLNLGKKIIKLEKEVAPTVILIKNSPNGSAVIVNGDIYTWGNNNKKTVSIGKNTYTKNDSIQGSGVPIINTMVRARAVNYNKDENIPIEDNYLNKENLYSAPSRVKFINMYLDNSKSICAISQKNELYCGGEDILENNYIDFIAYDRTASNRKNEYLYKSAFFDGKNNYIDDILFI